MRIRDAGLFSFDGKFGCFFCISLVVNTIGYRKVSTARLQLRPSFGAIQLVNILNLCSIAAVSSRWRWSKVTGVILSLSATK